MYPRPLPPCHRAHRAQMSRPAVVRLVAAWAVVRLWCFLIAVLVGRHLG
jgi:hypothetical protein